MTHPSVAELSRHPQFFLADALIARTTHVRRQLQQLVKGPANPLLVQDHPWESQAVQCYGNALRDPDSGLLRFWYFAAEERDPDDVPWLQSEGDAPDRPKRLYRACYAESEDGITWDKPMVNVLQTPLYDTHNILIEDIHSICVLHEPCLLETISLLLPEGVLVVNADLGAGGLTVELIDLDGRAIEGFGGETCRLDPVDAWRCTAQWGGRSLAARPRGGPVGLRFTLTGGVLYSFAVTP